MWSTGDKKESDTPLPSTILHDNFWWIVLAAFAAVASIFIFFPPGSANAATPSTDECRSSSEAVYAAHSRESWWATWSQRVPGHEGKRCWFAVDRSNKHSKTRAASRKTPPARREPEPIVVERPAPPPVTRSLSAARITASSRRTDAQAFDRAVEALMSPAKPDHLPNDFMDRWDGTTTRFSIILGSSHSWQETIGFLEVDGVHGRPLWALR